MLSLCCCCCCCSVTTYDHTVALEVKKCSECEQKVCTLGFILFIEDTQFLISQEIGKQFWVTDVTPILENSEICFLFYLRMRI